MIKAVIFDIDGVISDTQRLAGQIESEMLLKYNIRISPEEISQRYAGVKDIDQFPEIFKEANLAIDVKQFIEEKNDVIRQNIRVKLIPIPGVLNLIENLISNNFVLAVASASPLETVSLILEKLKLKEKVKAVITGNDVKHAKPNPEIYLLAAQKLSTDPYDSLVIEDATNGVQAAKSAGMKCIAITTTHKRSDLQAADLIIDSFDELTVDYIKSL